MATVIDLLTRYPYNRDRDPAENRLTAALAAAMELDRGHGGLAHCLGERWLGPSPDRPEARVTIQKPIRLSEDQLRFIDLELDFDGDDVVWVEIKLRSDETRTQLQDYEDALINRAHRRPPATPPPTHAPDRQ